MTQKKPVNPDVRTFTDHAFTTYRDKYQTRLIISGADTANAKRVLKTVEFHRLCQYWDWFLHYDGDDWQIKKATRDIKTFCGLINRIIQQCQIAPTITTTAQPGDDIVFAEVRATTRGEELYATMNPLEREYRLADIRRTLRKNETYANWDRETMDNTAIAMLKSELSEDQEVE